MINMEYKFLRIAIGGASGYIGTHLTNFFQQKGYDIISIPRNFYQSSCQEELKQLLSTCNVVINLSGASILHRWTDTYKKKLYESRIHSTHMLVKAINSLTKKPDLFISTSAAGYYPSSGCYDEYNAKQGKGFLADLCDEWEKEAGKLSNEVRLVITRFGIVLSAKEGAYPKMALPARLGLSTVLGSGEQFFPWISMPDLQQGMDFIIRTKELKGIVNFTAPGQITYSDFAKAMAKHYHSFAMIRLPAFLFRMVLGEAALFLTRGQCVIPTKLMQQGFLHTYPTIDRFLDSVTKKGHE